MLAGLNAEGTPTTQFTGVDVLTAALTLAATAAVFFALGGARVRSAEFVLDKS